MAEINREKVIKGLECCSEHIEDASCSDCPYVDDCDIGECTSELAHDTLSLLKEQEPVTYKVVKAGEKSYPFYDLVCTGCGNKTGMRMDWKYCPGCGRAVKWDG